MYIINDTFLFLKIMLSIHYIDIIHPKYVYMYIYIYIYIYIL